MDSKPPFTDVDIAKSPEGFYKGYSIPIALLSKLGMALLVIWAAVRPDQAKEVLSTLNALLLNNFNAFYIIAVGFFMCFCLLVAIVPSSGKRLLGRPGEKPEFSTFSWFSMMFGAGLGVGLMVFSTAEPMGLWGSNPVIVEGAVKANTAESVESAYRYTFLHYGFHAWAIYVVTGLSMAYYAFRRDMPLTIRTALTPVLGRWANGPIGHLVDILGVVATVLGIAVTIGFGVSQLVDGVYSISGMEWMMQPGTDGGPPTPSKVGLLAALGVVMVLSTISAVSGVGRGVKYLSNLNLVLSIVLISTFILFGSIAFAMNVYGKGLVDYILHLPELSFSAYQTDTDVGKWQKGWTTFYWAWWIAFAPFVGLFLARISRGRTIREFVLGAVIAPSLVCFLWMTVLGGTAIDLELSGVAGGKIIEATNTNKLFASMAFLGLEPEVLSALTVMCVVLILTFLITSADSGVLVLNVIMAGGDIDTAIKHRIIWGILITMVIATLLVAGGGGLDAIQNAMIIGALPFTMVMVLMCISLAKALLRDDVRDGHLRDEELMAEYEREKAEAEAATQTATTK